MLRIHLSMDRATVTQSGTEIRKYYTGTLTQLYGQYTEIYKKYSLIQNNDGYICTAKSRN
jgi:hypothetical protein